MRMTNNIMINNLKHNISRNMYKLSTLDTMLSTGKRINKPSDDPTGIVDSLRLSSRLRETTQYQANVADAKSWLESTDSTLGSLNSVLNRAYELTVKAANGTLSLEDRNTIKEELIQLKNEVITIANTSHGDRYVFGGKNTTETPYQETGWITPLNTAEIKYEIGLGITVPVNVTADQVFSAGRPGDPDDPSVPQDLLITLQQIIDHMGSDVAEDINSLGNEDLERLKLNIDTVLAARSQIGARVNRLEMASDRLYELEINLTSLKEDVEGVDPAKVILDMKNQENVYTAALAVGARIIQPTLVNFLN